MTKRSLLLSLFFLTLLIGFQLTFLFLLVVVANKELVRSLTMSTYQLGWVVIPIASTLFLIFYIEIKQRFFNATPLFFPISLLANLISSSIIIFGWSILTLASSITLFLSAQIIGMLCAGAARKWSSVTYQDEFIDLANQATLLFLLAGYFAVFLKPYEFPASKIAIFGYCIFLSSLLLYGYQSLLKKSWSSYLIDAIVIAMILLLVFDPRFFFSDFARHHQNFFLGPANDIMQGKDVLIDSYSQYGLFMPYALAFIFRFHLIPMTYPGFTLLVSGLYFLYYALIYFFLRKTLSLQWLSIITISAILFFNYMAVWWGFMPIIPAQGPFRYIWPFFILIAEVMKNKPLLSKKQAQITSILELVVIGTAAIWSIEVFIYTILTFLACQFYRCFSSELPYTEKLKRFFIQVGQSILACLIFWVLFLGLILIRSHQIPKTFEFANYLRFLTTYTYTEFMDPSIMPPAEYIQRYWVIGPALLFGSFVACIFYFFSKHNESDKNKIVPFAGLTVFGVLQFSYFFVFSSTGHFALICVPLILLAAFWFSEILRNNFPIHIKTSIAFGYLILVSFFVVAYSFYVTENRFSHTGLQYTFQYFSSKLNKEAWADNLTKRFLIYHPWNPETLEAERLVNQFFKNKEQVAIFIAPEDEVETLIRTGKTHLYPISDPELVQVVPQIEAQILSSPVKFHKGDHILVSNDRSKISSIEQKLFTQINQNYYLFPIAITKNYTIYEVG